MKSCAIVGLCPRGFAAIPWKELDKPFINKRTVQLDENFAVQKNVDHVAKRLSRARACSSDGDVGEPARTEPRGRVRFGEDKVKMIIVT